MRYVARSPRAARQWHSCLQRRSEIDGGLNLAIAPVIKSISPDTGTVGDGITDVNELMLVGTAGANSTVNVFDGTTLLGATTANSSGAWAFEAKALSNGAHSFTATSADATGTSPVSAPMGVTVVPNITSFSGANGSSITIDGMSAGVNNANQPWSLTEPDNHTLRFEVRVGDYWSTSGWSDLINDGGAGRSEIGLSPTYAPGTQVNVSYQLTVEPGAANTADWLLLNQMHATTQGPPPFAVEMDGEHMQVVLRYQKPGQTSATEVVAWRDPNPIQRGHAYAMNIQVNFDPNGNGYLNVWRDGAQIVKYQGAIGMAGASYYWKEGIYRSHTASETMAADYSNLNITTGAATAPTTPTQPTTPNVTPTVIQASA
jgi:hypothetical protein